MYATWLAVARRASAVLLNEVFHVCVCVFVASTLNDFFGLPYICSCGGRSSLNVSIGLPILLVCSRRGLLLRRGCSNDGLRALCQERD